MVNKSKSGVSYYQANHPLPSGDPSLPKGGELENTDFRNGGILGKNIFVKVKHTSTSDPREGAVYSIEDILPQFHVVPSCDDKARLCWPWPQVWPAD